MRRLLSLLIAALVALAAPSAAPAAIHIGLTTGVMTISDDVGDGSRFDLSANPPPGSGLVPGAYNVQVPVGANRPTTVVADPPCHTAILPTLGWCDAATITSVELNLNGSIGHTQSGGSAPIPVPMTLVGGTGSNSATIETAAPLTVDLGPGDDFLHVLSSAAASIAGGPGRDSITTTSTTPGNDMIVDGGDDGDSIEVLDAGSSATILGGGGADSIRAQGGPNTLNGGEGTDILIGYCCRSGDGQPYTPSATLPDGDRDVFICGPGDDTLATSRLQLEDSFAPDCPPYGAQTYSRPKITLDGAASRATLAVRVPFKERFTTAALYSYRKGRLGRNALATMVKVTTTVGGRATLVFRLTPTGRKELAGKTAANLALNGSAVGVAIAAEPAQLLVVPPVHTLRFTIRQAKRAA